MDVGNQGNPLKEIHFKIQVRKYTTLYPAPPFLNIMHDLLTRKHLKTLFRANYHRLKTGLDKTTREKFDSNLKGEIEIIIRKCLNKTYQFTRLKHYYFEGRKVYIPTIRDRLVIDLLKNSLSKKLPVSLPNREEIIKVLKHKFEANQECLLIRLDIKNFFDSIPQNFLLEKLKSSSSTSHLEYYLIKELLKIKKGNGVPTGLSLSSKLSEYYMYDVDKELSQIDLSINSYFRFVDDIIFVFNGIYRDTEKEYIYEKILRILKKNGLKVNQEKKKFLKNVPAKTDRKIHFDYLGYSFIKEGSKLEIMLSKEKAHKIKNKISFIFKDYYKNSNLDLLLYRLEYLTRNNTMIKQVVNVTPSLKFNKYPQKITFGVVDSYGHVDQKQWEELDKYLRGNIHTYLGHQIRQNKDLKNRLFSFSFLKTDEEDYKNYLHEFKSEKLIEILNNISNKKFKKQKYSRHELREIYKEKINL